MNKYECAVIYAPGLGTEVLEGSARKYTDIITSQGGAFKGLDDWGKRGLAYEIKYHKEGFYHFYKFEGSGKVIDELNRQLRIDENVLRHMIVRDEEKAASGRGEAAAAAVADTPTPDEKEES
ncbi:MAG: 30S ribosomal protein S6 [Candidatus Krumholzibacteriia bacterium]